MTGEFPVILSKVHELLALESPAEALGCVNRSYVKQEVRCFLVLFLLDVSFVPGLASLIIVLAFQISSASLCLGLVSGNLVWVPPA
ncbi:hypothetical protein DY000_02049847 [Brassica cretica]|uniref:Uncharacterized protein n=1 Tax=Brassica cretica TaxID=69181 RepID=A0ABQ7F762_BRACR|nr:hypothetical protein DY000_02049847 [Brassica cretica]